MKLFGYHIPQEIIIILAVIFSVLTICSVVFQLLYIKKQSSFFKELVIRTKSWWYMAIGIAVVITAPPLIGIIIIAYVSFVALREMLSISGYREDDRIALAASYLAIPVQYFLAYKMYYNQFFIFIPIFMFISIAFILVMTGKTYKVGRSMSLITSEILLTVYFLSHMALLFNVEIPNFSVGAGGLIIYLIMLTSFNDVFQFTWGKLLGKNKILPGVSPNKTWEGFIGGILTTALLSYLIRFLTPLSGIQAIVMGLTIAIFGFIGDSLISAVKRDLQIKDTDDLIPGHGGAMDRLDSIIITTPVFYHLLMFFIS